MKPGPFGYHRAESIAEAVELLVAYDGSARVLSGGQSLVPMLNMRLIRPDALVDVNGVAELRHLENEPGALRVGAMVRYHELERSPLVAARLPLVAKVLRHIGDRQVRNRGTIGGSLAHGDPTAEMPLACLVLGAIVRASGPDGSRNVPLEDFYLDAYTTTLDPLEVLTEVVLPGEARPSAFVELCRRHNDFPVISVACSALLDDDGRVRDVRVGLGGVAPTPILAPAVGTALEGSALSDGDIDEVVSEVLDYLDPASDVRASAEYRAHLAPVYVQRALRLLRDELAA